MNGPSPGEKRAPTRPDAVASGSWGVRPGGPRAGPAFCGSSPGGSRRASGDWGFSLPGRAEALGDPGRARVAADEAPLRWRRRPSSAGVETHPLAAESPRGLHLPGRRRGCPSAGEGRGASRGGLHLRLVRMGVSAAGSRGQTATLWRASGFCSPGRGEGGPGCRSCSPSLGPWSRGESPALEMGLDTTHTWRLGLSRAEN